MSSVWRYEREVIAAVDDLEPTVGHRLGDVLGVVQRDLADRGRRATTGRGRRCRRGRTPTAAR